MGLAGSWRVVSLLVSFSLVVGCGGGDTPKQRSVDRRTAAELPKLGEYMVPLHDGRIEVAPPLGWEIGSRKAGYVIWFKRSRDSAYPCILVSAEDYDEPGTVTESTVERFTRRLGTKLREEGKTVKGPSPILIDSFAGATYRSMGQTRQKFKTLVLERVFVTTAVDGWLYTFELRAPRDEPAETEQAVFAVAAGARFSQAATEPALDIDVPDGESAAESLPAEKKPRENAAAEEMKPPEKKPPSKKEPVDDESKFELLEDDEL